MKEVSELESDPFHPRRSNAVIGHTVAENAFLGAFNDGRLHHAWLITGPKGIGKATLAYRIAKFMLAKGNAGSGDPGLFGEPLPTNAVSLDVADDNPQLARVIAGSHGDLLSITRSVNQKTGKLRNDIVIEDVRAVTHFLNQTATEGGWRVVLIDSADDMNVSAANALLKILEEPPKKVLFLLVSHSPGRLLPTIRSRCRQIALTGLPADAITQMIQERFPSLSPEEALTLSVLSGGAPGRALELAAAEGLKIYTTMITLLAGLPRLDVPALHRFSDGLSAVKFDREYRIFRLLFSEMMERLIRFAATGQVGSPHLEAENTLFSRLSPTRRLDQWLELWEKMAKTFIRADAVNLDRRQIVLNCFSGLVAR